jgi:hypothetical protein
MSADKSFSEPFYNIVGWMVFGKDLADSAMYNLNQREEAFDAARRWGDSIVAVIQHPDTPKS